MEITRRINKGSFTVKLPFLDYQLGQAPDEYLLDYELELILLNKLKPLNKKDINEKIRENKQFKPKVVMFEGTVCQMMSTAGFLKTQWKFLYDSGLLSEASNAEVEKLLQLSDFEIGKLYSDSMYIIQGKYILEAKKKNPNIIRALNNYLFSQKPALIGNYKGMEYLVYFADEYSAPFLYFPLSSKDSLPNYSGFYARIIGTLNFASNIPMINNSSFIVKVAALGIPFNYNA